MDQVEDQRREQPEDHAQWPYDSLLGFGFFGADTPAGKRLVWRTIVPLFVILVSWIALAGGYLPATARAVFALAMPASIAAMTWANVRYLAELDELSRSIQLKAFAFSYGAVLTIAVALIALTLALPPAATRSIRPGSLLLALILVEPIRGMALVVLARRYQ